MNHSRHAFPFCLLSLFFFSSVTHADAAGASIGMNGIAIEYQKNLSEKLDARFILSDIPLSAKTEQSGIEYNIDYDRTNVGALVDYRPMAGAFHLTGGLYLNDHNWDLEATNNNGQFEIGDSTYTSNNLSLKARVAFAKAAPYLGLGWGNSINGTGITANLDIGLLYIGTPSVTASSWGQITSGGITIDVSSHSAFQNDLEKERAELEDDLNDFNVMPIIQVGMAYKF